MKALESDWYKKGWTLNIKTHSWVENTSKEVDFIIHTLGLKGGERILDLACGYGRHSLELARRGYSVVGVDITEVYVEDGNQNAQAEGLDAKFILSDIREVANISEFEHAFDVVLNMADGAIGYLENDEENLKSFDVIAKVLKPGGKHYMDIMSGDYADLHFPCQMWDAGEQGLTLSRFEWDVDTRIMIYGQLDYLYGKELTKPEMKHGNPTRLYTRKEVEKIMSDRGMRVIDAYADVEGKKASELDVQMIVVSEKML